MKLRDHRKMLIDTFVNAIYLYDDKIVLTFNYHDGTKTITFDDVSSALSNKNNGSDLESSVVPNPEVLKPRGFFTFWTPQRFAEIWKKAESVNKSVTRTIYLFL